MFQGIISITYVEDSGPSPSRLRSGIIQWPRRAVLTCESLVPSRCPDLPNLYGCRDPRWTLLAVLSLCRALFLKLVLRWNLQVEFPPAPQAGPYSPGHIHHWPPELLSLQVQWCPCVLSLQVQWCPCVLSVQVLRSSCVPSDRPSTSVPLSQDLVPSSSPRPPVPALLSS